MVPEKYLMVGSVCSLREASAASVVLAGAPLAGGNASVHGPATCQAGMIGGTVRSNGEPVADSNV